MMSDLEQLYTEYHPLRGDKYSGMTVILIDDVTPSVLRV